MWCAVSKRLAHGDTFCIKQVGRAPDRRLGAFVMDVPSVEMFQRTGVHDDERRMDDRSRIHQRSRDDVAAILDNTGEGTVDDGPCPVSVLDRQNPGGKPDCARGNHHFSKPVLAHQPRQSAGFRESHSGRSSRSFAGAGIKNSAQRPRWQEQHLPRLEIRCNNGCHFFMRMCRHR